MGIKYFNHEEGIELMSKMLFDRKLVPIIGSGFTCGCKSYGDTVPDGPRSIDIMTEKIKQHESDINTENYNFDKAASFFFRIVPKKEKENFFKTYFTKVVLDEERKSFLKLPWSHIYTLNVDDAIEGTGFFYAIYPYQNAKKPNRSDKLVYKIHGDANHELFYDSKDNIVFNSTQYIKSLTSVNNSTIINAIKADYKQKNLLFIGCGLSNEPDLKFIYNSVNEELIANAYRTIIRTKKLTIEDELNLEEYGINSVILVNNYRAFYIDFINIFNKYSVDDTNEHLFLNPQVTDLSDSKELTLKYFFGKNIFDSHLNSFYKSNMHITRSKISDIKNAIEKNNAIIIQGRRFSGKTYILCSLCEHIVKYNVLFFPSDILIDEDIISKLLKGRTDTLFLFDSNSLSEYAYQEVAHSSELLYHNRNKIVVAINSKDIYLYDNLEAEVIHISPKFYDKNELYSINSLANQYSLISRKLTDTNLDYLHRIKYEQKINIDLPLEFPTGYTDHEKVILFLLCVKDKLYYEDISLLDISFKNVDILIKSMKGLIEKIPVSKGEKIPHSSMKLIHNSKYILLEIMNTFNQDEIVYIVTYVVSKAIGDYTKKRFYVDTVLFDTLNQLFGKRNGAGNIIYNIYGELEKYLFNDMDYWLQRAKSIYRLKPNIKEELIKAYGYAKKSYTDGDPRVHAKSALTLSLISCFLSEVIQDTEETSYEIEAINYAYEAITSDYFKKIGRIRLNTEFESKNQNGESFYEKLIKLCKKHKLSGGNSIFQKTFEIERKLLDIKNN